MTKTYTFSDIKFGTIYLDPIFDENGNLLDFWLRIDAGLQEDMEEGIIINWNNHTIPLSEAEKSQVVTWLKDVIRPKIKTQLGL